MPRWIATSPPKGRALPRSGVGVVFELWSILSSFFLCDILLICREVSILYTVVSLGILRCRLLGSTDLIVVAREHQVVSVY